MDDAKLRERDKEDILGAAIWPLWPCLPLKSRKHPESGLRKCVTLYDAYSKIAEGHPDKFLVYKMSYDEIVALKNNPEREKILESVKFEYDSLDKLLDEWTVD